MQTLKQQLENRCIHFNGIFNNQTCKAGIFYEDVKVKDQRPLKIPCFKEGGECLLAEFLTSEEATAKANEIENAGLKSMVAYAQIKEYYEKTKETSGILKCACGSQLKYSVAPSNGHIWAKCSGCGIAFNE